MRFRLLYWLSEQILPLIVILWNECDEETQTKEQFQKISTVLRAEVTAIKNTPVPESTGV